MSSEDQIAVNCISEIDRQLEAIKEVYNLPKTRENPTVRMFLTINMFTLANVRVALSAIHIIGLKLNLQNTESHIDREELKKQINELAGFMPMLKSLDQYMNDLAEQSKQFEEQKKRGEAIYRH